MACLITVLAVKQAYNPPIFRSSTILMQILLTAFVQVLFILLHSFWHNVVTVLVVYFLIYQLFMSLLPDNVRKSITFSGRPSTAFVHSFVCLTGQISLPQYFMNSWSNLDETYFEYSLVPTDGMFRF